MSHASRRGSSSGVPRLVELPIRVVAAAALAVDAYVHADLAPTYDLNSASISQGDLFRIEAALAALAALLVLFFRNRLVRAYAFLVAAGGLAAVLVYRYIDLGAFGPFPDMYEPLWFAEKTASFVAEAVATGATAVLLALPRRR
ncbi:hypothetical protein [Streptomyces odontomachi]|uniref:hypothetical protein n=1 Tax=Streptomyces odontomachi TaxID=2944940 RepID=UPI00210C43C1|nr:hypothetical protein [Streptomyces sp. ODS25]